MKNKISGDKRKVLEKKLEEIERYQSKQYPIGGYATGGYTCNCVTCKKKFIGDKTAIQCEPCAIEMISTKVKVNNSEGVEVDYKQETLEEAAENKYPQGVYVINGIDICQASRECFIQGAKYQEQKMYSRKEVLEIITRCKEYLSFGDEFDEKKWFEQY